MRKVQLVLSNCIKHILIDQILKVFFLRKNVRSLFITFQHLYREGNIERKVDTLFFEEEKLIHYISYKLKHEKYVIKQLYSDNMS